MRSIILVDLLQTTGTRGGIEVYVRELYSAIANSESNYDFVGYAGHQMTGSDFSWFPGEVTFCPLRTDNKISWALAETVFLSTVTFLRRPAALHCPAMLGPVLSNCPVILTIHDLSYFTRPDLTGSRLSAGFVRLMERSVARISSAVITISEFTKDNILKFLPRRKFPIHVIPLAPRKLPTIAPLDSSRDVHFLAMGQRSPYKDFDTIVRAWAEIPEASRKHLVITGSHGADPLIALVQELELEAWVDLRDWVSDEDLAGLMGNAIALIDSTLETGFSLPATEAIALGIPVILADTEIFREVGQNRAHYYEPGSPQSLARVIENTFPGRGEVTPWRNSKHTSTSWEDVALKTLQVFREAIK